MTLPGQVPDSKTERALLCIARALRRRKAELDGDAGLRSLTIIVKWHASSGTPRLLVVERGSEDDIRALLPRDA